MTSTNFVGIQQRKNELIRKQLEGSVFITTDQTSESVIPSITLSTDSGAGLLPLPTGGGYRDLGYLTKDGAKFSENISASDVTSWGEVEPTRTDITSETTTLQVACQETNIKTLEVYTGADLSSVTPPASGEVAIAAPARPSLTYYRAFVLGVDLTSNGELYIGRFLPKCSVSNKDDQAFADGDDPTLWGVTLTAYKDTTLGFASKYFFGGPGWLALVTDMGFA